MKESAPFKKRYDRFLHSLLSSIEHFRIGEDHSGLDCYLNSLIDLEMILELYPFTEETDNTINEIVLVTKGIYINMQNQDIVGLTDALEFKLYPLAQKWCEGW
jgi:hypothetical protein